MGRLFLYLISIFWIVMGVLLIFAPELVKKKVCKKLLEKSDLKKLSALPLIFGVLLLMTSTYNAYRLLVILLGILAIVKGVAMIVATEKMQKMTDWWLNKASKNILRVWGVVAIVIGSVVLMGI